MTAPDLVARHILTGAPGSGKTAILRQLEWDGYPVVEEAATDVIALRQAQGDPEPWQRPAFVADVARLQRRRQQAFPDHPVQVFDRSPVCTMALAAFLGHPVGPVLAAELDRIRTERVYRPQVLLVRQLGFVTRTEARRISLAEARRFERFHLDAYAALGYECVPIDPGPLAERVAAVKAHLAG
ncbi:AAA family ATPase [Kitasatospora sp. NPDC058965]|uniref:AAA family ATPase n=1 Tax=Kitasatospora sp. NPDC058965 TaxID=3346682 RepID=UPI0036B66A70